MIHPSPLGLRPIETTLEVPSAQVKSAILLAGLYVPGRVIIHQPILTRAHTEVMFQSFGVHVDMKEGGHLIEMDGQQDLIATSVHVPAGSQFLPSFL